MKNKGFGMIGKEGVESRGATIIDPKLKIKALNNGNIFFSAFNIQIECAFEPYRVFQYPDHLHSNLQKWH